MDRRVSSNGRAAHAGAPRRGERQQPPFPGGHGRCDGRVEGLAVHAIRRRGKIGGSADIKPQVNHPRRTEIFWGAFILSCPSGGRDLTVKRFCAHLRFIPAATWAPMRVEKELGTFEYTGRHQRRSVRIQWRVPRGLSVVDASCPAEDASRRNLA